MCEHVWGEWQIIKIVDTGDFNFMMVQKRCCIKCKKIEMNKEIV
jgi:hypothetical protein